METPKEVYESTVDTKREEAIFLYERSTLVTSNCMQSTSVATGFLLDIFLPSESASNLAQTNCQCDQEECQTILRGAD